MVVTSSHWLYVKVQSIETSDLLIDPPYLTKVTHQDFSAMRWLKEIFRLVSGVRHSGWIAAHDVVVGASDKTSLGVPLNL